MIILYRFVGAGRIRDIATDGADHPGAERAVVAPEPVLPVSGKAGGVL